ncbi:MAG TPA: rhodanese-like domain-containing protein [Candidatus Koribacter sp.]
MTRFIDVRDLSPSHKLIDVRTPTEFAAGHIAGALNVPLDLVEARIDDLDPNSPLVLVCKAGTRARLASELLAPCRQNTAVLAGGMDAWYRAGQPVVVSSRSRWSLERQVRLGAGLLVLLGVIAAFTLNSRWILLSGFVGLGLIFAGLTDVCAMGSLLARMPWNRNSKLHAIRNSSTNACALKG